MMSRGRRQIFAAATVLVFVLSIAPPASATFHLIQIREVFPGSTSNPQAEYVELQMYESDQNFVGGHVLRTYDASGSSTKANVLGSDVPNGANQRTVLIATPEAEAQFGLQTDAALIPSGQLDPAAGAVCWEALDCVTWGGFAGSTPSPTGSPADPFGIPNGMALRRSIASHCPSLLEESDDSDNSAADFADAFPAPRPNSATPAEQACTVQTGGGSGNPQNGTRGHKRPSTRIVGHPPRRIRDRTPTIRFTASVAGSTYRCKLDRHVFKRCRSPFTASRLSFGRHVFKVEARGPDGMSDRTPAIYRFKVIRSASGR